jgi:hypothetical protein
MIQVLRFFVFCIKAVTTGQNYQDTYASTAKMGLTVQVMVV